MKRRKEPLPIGPRRWQEFMELLAWIGNFEPEPYCWPSETGVTLPARDYRHWHKWQRRFIRRCKREDPLPKER